MSRRFDDVLNECLDRVAIGEDIERCASDFPEHREQLVPLLRVAWSTMRAAKAASYRPQAKMHGLARLAQAYTEGRMHKKRRWTALIWRPVAKPLLIGFMVVTLTAAAAGGTTVASAGSVPGEPLYWIKTTKETLALRMARSDAEKAEVHLQLASVRGYEIQELTAAGRYSEAQMLIERLRYHLRQSAAYAGVRVASDPIEMPHTAVRVQRVRDAIDALDMRESLQRDGTMLRQGLLAQMESAPSGQQEQIQRIIRQSDLGYRILLDALAEQNASFNPQLVVQEATAGQ